MAYIGQSKQYCAGLVHATTIIVRTEGAMALYKGLLPTLLGIAPYAALNFALYDLAKKWFYDGGRPQGVLSNLLLGAATGTVAATVCYPLDTVRRRMQMKGKTYNGQIHAMTQIARTVRSGWQRRPDQAYASGAHASCLPPMCTSTMKLT